MQSVPTKLIETSQPLTVIAELATRPDTSLDKQGFAVEMKNDLPEERMESHRTT